jgi:hypothetical protein
MTLTDTAAPAAATERRSDAHARVAGVLYLVTFASSIPALLLLAPVLHHADYVIGAAGDTRVLWGCLLDLVNAVACVGTAVALFPVMRGHGEALALGFVTSRMFEAAVIVIGVVSLLAVVTLHRDAAGASGAEAATLVTTAKALVAVRDWTFLLGPSFMAATNALLLGTLLRRSGLVPRWIPTLGLVGAPLLVAASLAVFFGGIEQVSTPAGLATLPVAAWELSVGVWMATRGFRSPAR